MGIMVKLWDSVNRENTWIKQLVSIGTGFRENLHRNQLVDEFSPPFSHTAYLADFTLPSENLAGSANLKGLKQQRWGDDKPDLV